MSKDGSQISRIALWLTMAIFVIAWLWGALAVGDWEDKWVFLAVIGVVGILLAGLFFSSRRFAPRLPTTRLRVSDPRARDYWNSPEHRDEFNRRISVDLEWIGAATMLLLTAIIVVFGSAAGAPVNDWSLIVPVAVFVVVVLAYCLNMIFGSRYRAEASDITSPYPPTP